MSTEALDQQTGSEGESGFEGFATVEEAVVEVREGRVIIVVDDADRENEGDFVMAAEKVTPEAINFMATHGRGIICMPCEGERLDELRIPLMVASKLGSHETPSRSMPGGPRPRGRARTIGPSPSRRYAATKPSPRTYRCRGTCSPCGPRRAGS